MNEFDLLVDKYDQWKLNSAFYKDYEYPIVLNYIRKYLKGKKEINILDIGTGTGFWIEIIVNMLNNECDNLKVTSLGVDISLPMIENAKKKNIKNANFFVKDVTKNQEQLTNEKFDLITAGLCIDYIGVDPTLNFIANNLKKEGTSLLWFFNPDRYAGKEKIITKKWEIMGQIYEIHSNRISLDEIQRVSSNLNLSTKIETIELPKSQDNISRRFEFQVTKFKY